MVHSTAVRALLYLAPVTTSLRNRYIKVMVSKVTCLCCLWAAQESAELPESQNCCGTAATGYADAHNVLRSACCYKNTLSVSGSFEQKVAVPSNRLSLELSTADRSSAQQRVNVATSGLYSFIKIFWYVMLYTMQNQAILR